MQKFVITPKEQTYDAHGTRTVLSAHIGQGHIKMVSPFNGMQILINHYRLCEPMQMQYLPIAGGYGFGFCLSGDIKTLPAGFKNAFDVRTGQSAFFHFAPDKMEESIGTCQVARVSIMLSPDLLESIMDKYPARQIPVLKQYPCRVADALTPEMRRTLLQIIHCSFEGPARDFFLEGKALELLAHKLDQLSQDKGSKAKPSNLTPQEIDQVQFAAQYLIQDLENIPDMHTLARKVGMNRSKLHFAFRRVLGQTPFAYLHQHRMETAKTLLCEKEMNVTQAAYAVGYSSLSHFSKAFKEYFGFLPGKITR